MFFTYFQEFKKFFFPNSQIIIKSTIVLKTNESLSHFIYIFNFLRKDLLRSLMTKTIFLALGTYKNFSNGYVEVYCRIANFNSLHHFHNFFGLLEWNGTEFGLNFFFCGIMIVSYSVSFGIVAL